jgi:hypothetical protein
VEVGPCRSVDTGWPRIGRAYLLGMGHQSVRRSWNSCHRTAISIGIQGFVEA